MRKATLLFLFIVLTVALLPSAAVLAGPSECEFANQTGPAQPDFNLGVKAFNEGDVLKFTATGAGEGFTVWNALTDEVLLLGLMGEVVKYEVMAEGEYEFVVTVETNYGEGTEATVTCAPYEEEEEEIDYEDYDVDGDGKVELCHFPGGNKDAAHTISVGVPAVKAHLAHGDTIGSCDAEDESRYDDLGAGIAVFILEAFDQVQIWGACEGTECSLVIVFDLSIVEPVEGGEWEFDEDPDDEWYGMVYFLHPHPELEGVYVFQLNIYENDTLLSDAVLVFINEDGDIVGWASHDVWDLDEEDD